MPNAPDLLSRREGRSPGRAIGLLLILYLVTRVGSLHVLPIFLDEAVHIQWAERLYEEGRILRPVGAGRLLAVAVYGLALPFEDRLWAARFLAAVAGALTLVFTYLLSRCMFGNVAGLLAGLLYIASPFALVYDRLALSDVFLSASVAGVMFATWGLAERPSVRSWRILLALMIILAIAAKVSALLFFGAVPLGLLALARDRRAALRAAAPVALLGLVCASPILWVFYSNSGEIAAQHVQDPLASGPILVSTLRDMRGWVLSYFSLTAVIAALLSAILLRDGRALWLGGAVVVPFVFFALVSQPWSARYILPVLPPMLILISGGIDRFAGRFSGGAGRAVALSLTLGVAFQGLVFDRYLLSDPSDAPFPEDDRRQLVTGWPAGYGIHELAQRLRDEAAQGAITAYVDTGGTRTVPTSLAVLLAHDPRIRLVESDLGLPANRASMVAQAATTKVVAILGPRNESLDFPSSLLGAVAERVAVYQRPEGEWTASLFRLKVRIGAGGI